MLKVFLVEDEAVIRDGLRDKIPWEQYGFSFVGRSGRRRDGSSHDPEDETRCAYYRY